MAGDALIEARALTKRFGDFTAVDGIDFTVQRGETFGFLGPNGAGKTSTMRMIGAVSPRSSGELRVLGFDPGDDGPTIKQRMGVVPQQDTLDFELTVYENLLVYGRYFGIPMDAIKRRADELLEFVQLHERRDSRVEPLSGGMKRRLTIARALINEPEFLLLDEPTTGLDPQARHVLWDRLYRLKQQGVTQVLTTHYMDEAEQLCDRLVVMDHGKIVAEGSPRELIGRLVQREVVEVRFTGEPSVDGHFDGLGERIEVLADRILIGTNDGDATAHAVHELGLPIESVLVRRSTLEDVFLTLAAVAAAPSTTPLQRAAAVTAWHARSYRRVWRATVTTAFLNPVFFLLSVGVLLGKLIDDDQAALGGLSYVEFVAPALIATTAMQLGANDAMWPILAGIRWLRTYHAVLATPVRVAELVVGEVAWCAIRMFVAATIFTAVAAIGGAIDSPLAVVVPFAAVLTGLAFHAPISAFSSSPLLEDGDDGWFPAINRFVIIPMFLFSGTFFPISQLPDWLEPVAWATPLWHGIELCRDLSTGSVGLLPTLVHVGYLSSLVVVGIALSIRFHHRQLLK